MFTIQYREPIWLDRAVVKTKMALTKDSPYHFNTVIVDGDHRETAVEVLLPLAMEALHKDLFVDKAIPEAIQKVDEMDAKLKEVDAFLTKAKEDFQAIADANELSKGTLVELGEMVFGHEEKIIDIEDKVHVLENRNAIGD